MTLTELQAKLVNDLRIDPTNLLEETSSNMNKHAWYFSQLLLVKAQLKKAQMDFKALEADRYNFYAGKRDGVVHTYGLDNKGIVYNLNGDREILQHQKGVLSLELKLEFFVKACELFKERGYAIKNQIELLKFQNGIG